MAENLGGYPWLEMGWANSSSTAPLTTYGNAADGTPMPGGIDFANFVLGLAHGKLIAVSGGLGTAGTPVWDDVKAPANRGGGPLGRLLDGAFKNVSAAANKWGQKKSGTG